ncbi:hypothetical protein B0J17DRAFT_676808 [Rhizoctonia solani]|nr:hypothetical protein B0J17DRAFT_676808 [Rhizoctonia solani]
MSDSQLPMGINPDGPDLRTLLDSPSQHSISDINDYDIDSDSDIDSATNYYEQLAESGDIQSLDEEIERLKGAILSEPECHLYLSALGKCYQSRFQYFRDAHDLDQCIEYTSLAVALSPDGDQTNLFDDLDRLSICYHLRFHNSNDIQDLEKQIEYGARALSINQGRDTDTLQSQAQALYVRFEHTGNHSDLEEAIKWCTLAISLTSEQDPDLLEMLDTINILYHTRFMRSSDLESVNASIKYGTMAVSFTTDNDPELPLRLRYLSGFHREAFYHSSNPTDIDQCIEYGARAVSVLPEDHKYFPRQLQDLSTTYMMRFRRLGDSSDLARAIENSCRIVLLEPDDLDQHTALTNLSQIFHARFRLRGDVDDLERGIESSAQAFSLTNSAWVTLKDPELEATRLDSLGGLYFSRYEKLGEPNDLDDSIECCRLAISLAPSESPSMAASLTCLGRYFHARWHLVADIADLDESIQCQTRAVSLFSPHLHSDLPAQLQNIGKSYLEKFRTSKDKECSPDLGHALNYMRRACQSSGPPLEKFEAAVGWAGVARTHGKVEYLGAYQTAMDLIPQVIWLGRTLEQRYQDTEKLRSIAAQAASAAISAGDYKRALEWLEQGRSIVMNQNSMLQSPLDSLHLANSALAERLQDVAIELHSASSRGHNSHGLTSNTSSIGSGYEGHRHRQLAKVYDDLLVEIRRLPGFGSFLQPKRAAELVSAARSGPIVVINLDRSDCDALIVFPGDTEITHLGLPAFSSEKAVDIQSRIYHSLTRGIPGERSKERHVFIEPVTSDFEHMLSVLWEDIVKPVFDFLGYKPNPTDDTLPHITWCTTGALSSLPLHAAGTFTEAEDDVCSSNYAISSYTPNLTGLLALESNPESSLKHSNILVVGQNDTPGHSRLPGVIEEINHIDRHAGSLISRTRLTGNNATTEATLDAMDGHDWVHLACHAHQSVGDPTQSGFFLHDACQTAKGDEKLPDETIHLASGLLNAGYPSVIATMWSVWDEDAPFVADMVYGHLLKDGKMDYRESGKALHYAVRALRKKIGSTSFERWVPFIHIGI